VLMAAALAVLSLPRRRLRRCSAERRVEDSFPRTEGDTSPRADHPSPRLPFSVMRVTNPAADPTPLHCNRVHPRGPLNTPHVNKLPVVSLRDKAIPTAYRGAVPVHLESQLGTAPATNPDRILRKAGSPAPLHALKSSRSRHGNTLLAESAEDDTLRLRITPP